MAVATKTQAKSLLVKSKQRVRELGEVFTGEEQVTAMLDLVSDQACKPASRFLEPACGNGNFLVEILNRKLAVADAHYRKVRKQRAESKEDFEGRRQDEYEFILFIAVSSIYGIDISEENVQQTRDRLRVHLLECYNSSPRNVLHPKEGFVDAVVRVLETNIQLGDSLNGTSDLFFTEYTFPGTDIEKGRYGYRTTERHFSFDSMLVCAETNARVSPESTSRAHHFRAVAP